MTIQWHLAIIALCTFMISVLSTKLLMLSSALELQHSGKHEGSSYAIFFFCFFFLTQDSRQAID